VDLVELVTSAVEDFQVMAQENSISVSLDAPTEPVWVRGDKQRLRQVLFILGDNACRYSKPGGHIAVDLRADENEACLSLSDQGIGIPAQDLERIFDRHFRSKNALCLRDDGTGLGLPMAKSILTAHGGRITVASTENSGSKFTVTLPLISVEQDNSI
jgi:two-component system OmpR family sensor kinase